MRQFAGSPLCDGVNEQGFSANMSQPQSSNFGVARIDHDFGSKFHFTSSYRYYRLDNTTSSQVDIGGFFPGDTLGTPASVSNRPQQPWYYVAGLTINVTSNTTNDLHFSYLRNYWSWNAAGGPPQISGPGGALEPFGETATQTLAPYNVNTQNVRTRFWDGQDKFLRDDWTMLKGNHLMTFGGAYQKNYDWHQRSDNGGGINYTPTYQLGLNNGGNGSGGNVDFSSTLPNGVNANTWGALSSVVLGIVSQSQIAYTRQGPDLALNPPLTHAQDQSTIPYYNVYWSDSWHMKPSFTLTYGLGYTLEMPPTEAQGRQIELVGQNGQVIDGRLTSTSARMQPWQAMSTILSSALPSSATPVRAKNTLTTRSTAPSVRALRRLGTPVIATVCLANSLDPAKPSSAVAIAVSTVV